MINHEICRPFQVQCRPAGAVERHCPMWHPGGGAGWVREGAVYFIGPLVIIVGVDWLFKELTWPELLFPWIQVANGWQPFRCSMTCWSTALSLTLPATICQARFSCEAPGLATFVWNCFSGSPRRIGCHQWCHHVPTAQCVILILFHNCTLPLSQGKLQQCAERIERMQAQPVRSFGIFWACYNIKRL